MANIAALLKAEIIRLAKKEARAEVESLKKASAQFRSDIAALKRRISDLEKQASRLCKKSAARMNQMDSPDENTQVRFSPKGLTTHRQRLGLSAAEAGQLLGVSAQTVYHWEGGKTRPRPQQLGSIAHLRAMGKRQAAAKLLALAGEPTTE